MVEKKIIIEITDKGVFDKNLAGIQADLFIARSLMVEVTAALIEKGLLSKKGIQKVADGLENHIADYCEKSPQEVSEYINEFLARSVETLASLRKLLELKNQSS